MTIVLRNPSSSSKLRIAFSFPSGIAMAERIQQGIISYAQQRGGWSITRHPEMLGTAADWLQNWRGNGAFVFAITSKEAAMARALKLPVVNLSSHLAKPELPTVSTDHYAIGRMAAEHFLAKNFRRLAFYGPAGLYYSQERRRGFYETAGKHARLDQLIVPIPSEPRFRCYKQEKTLDDWLKKLERPVGIFASTDLRASIVLEACERLGFAVPRDVAVLGVDNDPMVYDLSTPALSSVSRNDFEVGRRAAMLLESLIFGKAARNEWITVPPEGVIDRESTRTLAVDDPVIAEAVEKIQSRIGQHFGAQEIVDEAPISRRRFEARFLKALRCTPYSFINSLRVERAKALLERPENLSQAEMAAACGFTSATRFRLVFARITGKLPSQWRSRHDPSSSFAATRPSWRIAPIISKGSANQAEK